jgi:hypothetical protein
VHHVPTLSIWLSLAAATLVLASCEERPELAEPSRVVSSELIPLDAVEGQRLLFESEARAAFVPLISHFETQESVTHCGPATLAMVLNALEAPAPSPRGYSPYRFFTQDNVLNGLTDDIISEGAVSRRGMSLRQLAGVLRAYGLDAEAHYASASSVEDFRARAIEFLGREDHHVIVNYSRTALEQHGGGHISPLGAYDAESDRFLILDVSRYKAPPVWVRAPDLFAAMAAPVEPASETTRGFVLVRKASPPQE